MNDLISRQAAIDALAEWHDAAITNRLNNLPSAQPGWSEQYKNKQSNCKKMPLPEPWKGEEHGTSRAVLSQKPVC